MTWINIHQNKNEFFLTIATLAVLTFYADSKYRKVFKFIRTNPKPIISENIPYF